jgi:hypothetical protein
VDIIPTAELGGHEWRFTTADPGAGWQGADFRDDNWRQGRGAFATFGKPDVALRTLWQTADVWLRTRVPVPALEGGTLVFAARFEGDLEVFVNGQEIVRRPGPVVGYWKQQLGPQQVGAFRAGTNLIAIHCRNAGGGQVVDVGLQWRPGTAQDEPASPTVPPVARKDAPGDVDVGEVYRLEGHGGTPRVAWSPDGKFLLSGGGRLIGKDGERVGTDFPLRLWDAATGKLVRRFIGHTRDALSVAFSPDSRFVLSGGYDGEVRLWDVQTGKEVRQFKGHTSGVFCVVFSQDGEYALSCGSRMDVKEAKWVQVPDERPLRLWEVATGKEVPFATVNPPPSGALSAAFSVDGRKVVAGLNDATVRVYDRATGKEQLCLRGHKTGIDSIACSPDGRHVLTTSAGWGVPDSTEAQVTLWDLWEGRQVRRLGRHPARSWVWVAFTPDGRHALTAWQLCLRCWEVATGRQTAQFDGHGGTITAVAISPDGRRAATASHDRTVRVWQLPAEGALAGELRGGPARPEINGLKAELFLGANFERKVQTRIDAQVDFDEVPGPAELGKPAGPFSIRWTGWLVAPRPGRYRLGASSAAGLRLWLDGQLLIDRQQAPRDQQVELR